MAWNKIGSDPIMNHPSLSQRIEESFFLGRNQTYCTESRNLYSKIPGILLIAHTYEDICFMDKKNGIFLTFVAKFPTKGQLISE